MSLIPWIVSEILGVAIIIAAGLYIYYKYFVFNFWRKFDIFCPEPSFPTGNIWPIVTAKESVGECFKSLYDQHKQHRLFGVFGFFRPNLVICDPDLVRDVLTKDFASFHDRGLFCNEKTDPLTGHLFSLPGQKWRNLRVKLTPTFTSGKIKQMFLTFKESGDALAKFLESKAQARTNVEIKDIFARYSTDIIMSTAFGVSCNTLENPDNEFRYYGRKVFEPRPIWNAILIFAPQIFDFFSLTHTDKGVTKFFMTTFKDTVTYRETNNIVRKDFLELLIQLMRDGYVAVDDNKNDVDAKKAVGNKLTMTEAAAQAYVFYLAGFETSSTAGSFTLYELALNQDIQDKVRQEIKSVLQKHGELSYNAINEMTYLHKVLSESMRKYPPVGVLNRVCTKEIELPSTNRRIPVGTQVTIPVFGLHRDPSIYPDPDKFDPERFNEENIAARHPYVYLPFGEGPRICIGMRFGLIQTKVALVSILSKYKLKPTPTTPIPMVFDGGNLIMTPEKGVDLLIEPA